MPDRFLSRLGVSGGVSGGVFTLSEQAPGPVDHRLVFGDLSDVDVVSPRGVQVTGAARGSWGRSGDSPISARHRFYRYGHSDPRLRPAVLDDYDCSGLSRPDSSGFEPRS